MLLAIAGLEPFNVCHGGVFPLACRNMELIILQMLYDEDVSIIATHLLF